MKQIVKSQIFKLLLIAIFSCLTGFSVIAQTDPNIEWELGSNPSYISRGGAPETFSVIVRNLGKVTYANLKFEITVPNTNWTIQSTTPASTGTAQKVSMTIASLGENEEQKVTINISAGCNAVNGNLLSYKLYNGNTVIAERTVLLENLWSPNRVQTFNRGTYSCIPNVEYTRIWNVSQTMEGVHIQAKDLKVSLTQMSDLTVNKVFITDKDGNELWEVTNRKTNISGGFRYDFMEEDFTYLVTVNGDPGNGDGKLDAGEVLYVKEYYMLTSCNYGGNTQYTISSPCQGNSTQSWNYVLNIPSNGNVKVESNVYPKSKTEDGKIVFTFENTGSIPLVLPTLTASAQNNYEPTVHMYMKSLRYCNPDGTDDPSKQAIVYTETNRIIKFESGNSYYQDFESQLTGFNNNDTLKPREKITMCIEYNYNFEDAQDCFGRDGRLLYASLGVSFTAYDVYCNQKRTYSNSMSNSPYLTATASNIVLNKTTLNPGDAVTLTMNDGISISNYQPATKDWPYYVIVEIPKGFIFNNNASCYVKAVQAYTPYTQINIAKTDIQYETDPVTGRTKIRFKYPIAANQANSSWNYTIGLIVNNEDDSSNQRFEVRHETQYPGYDPILFGCTTFDNLKYTIYETGSCQTIGTSFFQAERTTFGFRSEHDLTIMTYEEAKAAGADLKVAGPYDNVRFRAQAYLYNDVSLNETDQLIVRLNLKSTGAISYDSFKFLGATIRYSTTGNTDNNFGENIQQVGVGELIISKDANYITYITLDLKKHIGTGKIIPELKQGNYIEVSMLAQVQENGIPTSVTAISNLGMEFYIPGMSRQNTCYQSDVFSVVNYKLYSPNRSTAGSPTYTVGGEIKGGHLLKIPQTANLSTKEIFINEYRPNIRVVDIGRYTIPFYNIGQVIDVSKIYDWRIEVPSSHYDTTYYSNSISTYIKLKTSQTDIMLYSPELYKSTDNYIIYLDGKSICVGTNHPNYFADYGMTTWEKPYTYVDYPTSAAPQSREIYEPNVGTYFGTYQQPNFTVSVSNLSNQQPVDDSLSWTISVRNISYSTLGNLNNCYIGLEMTTYGDPQLSGIKVYDSNGNLYKGEDNAGIVPYSGDMKKWWIKLGTIGNGPKDDGFTTFTIKAKINSCTSSTGNIYFGQGAEYPPNPETGNPKYGGIVCGRSTYAYTAAVPALQYTTSITVKPGTQIDGKYDFCDSLNVVLRIDNGSTANTISNVFAKVQKTGLYLDESINPKIRFKNQDYAPKSIVHEGEYIYFYFPDAVVLETYSIGGGKFTSADLSFTMRMNCNLLSGQPIYAEVGSRNSCSTAVHKIVSPNIHLMIDPNDLPVLEVKTLTMPSVIDLKNASDGEFVFTGTYTYKSNPKNNVKAEIELPDNLRLNGTATLKFENNIVDYFVEDGSSNHLSAMFDKPLNENLTYTMEIPLKAVNPGAWNCEEHAIRVMCTIGIQRSCADNNLNCYVKNILDEDKVSFRMNKYDISIIADLVKMEEQYDALSSTMQKIAVSGKVKNNESVAIPEAAAQLYFIDMDSTVLATIDIPGGIPAGGTVDFRDTVIIAADKICVMSLTTNDYVCNRPLIKKEITYKPGITNYIYGCDITGDIPVGDPLISANGESYKYTWSPTTHLKNITSAQPLFFFGNNESTAGTNQKQKYTVSINRPNGCMTSANIEVYIIPEKTKWLGIDNDWNNTNNWDNGIPGYCTYTVIQKEKSKYPEIRETTKAECGTIEIEAGAEVAQTPYLAYNNAIVHLDIPEDKWYMLAPPLRNMYSGDYILSDNRRDPRVFMMQYQEDNPERADYAATEGKWSMPFSTLGIPLTLGMGYVVYVDLQNYPTAASISRNSFVFPQDTTSYNYHDINTGVITDKPKVSGLERTNSGRFIYEEDKAPADKRYLGNADLQIPVKSGYEMALVGNPFMSHLNFNALVSANNSKIANTYYLWSGTSFDVANDGAGWSTMPQGSSLNIPPQQSFIVKRTDNNFTSLKMTPDMSVTAGGASLRSAISSDNIINMELRREGKRQSAVTIIYNEGVENKFNENKDAYTLFSATTKQPAILYSPLNGKAVSVRTIGDMKEVIPLNIRTSMKGQLTFETGNIEVLDPRIQAYLIDRENNVVKDLRTYPSYTFNNETGDIQNRFFLLLSKSATELDNIKTSMSVYAVNNVIHVQSYTNDPIKKVDVINMQGNLLYTAEDIYSDSHVFSVPLHNQAVIVKVQTENSFTTNKVIIK